MLWLRARRQSNLLASLPNFVNMQRAWDERRFPHQFQFVGDVSMDTKCSIRCGVGIAIAEDEKALVDAYRKVFKTRGIEVCFVAFDGTEAVKKYLECTPKPHAIIMDYRMPIMNGIEATKTIIRIDPDAKVIFLSADIDIKSEAIGAGAMIFIKKPASITEILAAVRKVLGPANLLTIT